MFAAAAMFCAATFAGYTAYEQATMTDAERMMQANIEALTYNGEFNGQDWNDGDDSYSGGDWYPAYVSCTLGSSTGGSVSIGCVGVSWEGSTTTISGHKIDCQNGDGNCWNGTECIADED